MGTFGYTARVSCAGDVHTIFGGKESRGPSSRSESRGSLGGSIPRANDQEEALQMRSAERPP